MAPHVGGSTITKRLTRRRARVLWVLEVVRLLAIVGAAVAIIFGRSVTVALAACALVAFVVGMYYFLAISWKADIEQLRAAQPQRTD